MYKFVDIDEAANNSDMSIQTIVNGFNLDKTINGFTTLKVNGRELIGRNISTQDFKAVSGGGKRETSRNYKSGSFGTNRFLGSSLPSRTIEVEFMLRAESNKEFRQVCEMLNFYLHNEQMSVQFTDDLAYEYIGTLTAVSDIDAVSNSIVGSFSIECSEPFKYSANEKVFEFDTTGKFNYKSLYPVIINKIIVEVEGESEYFRIINYTTESSVVIDTPIKKGDVVEVDMKDQTVLLNSEDVISKLALDSQLEDFLILGEDNIVCDSPCKAKIFFVERRL
ncbi:distal tail protein Dit [Miniphocaeibacter massiliensis]|uniref:distal tail protein Dit n=1 Tax=Miniphocaeibacter massiliensis TaxID=2041841 RepID=UPI000C1BDB29|nr:distal tail protein Dit [Miniphocaeibacter massiliensis]